MPAYMWTLTELHLSFLTSCLVCLGSLLKAILKKMSPTHDSRARQSVPTDTFRSGLGWQKSYSKGSGVRPAQNSSLDGRSRYAQFHDADEHELVSLPREAHHVTSISNVEGPANKDAFDSTDIYVCREIQVTNDAVGR